MTRTTVEERPVRDARRGTELSTGTFHRIRDLIYRVSGIVLSDAKSGLVVVRLQSRLRQLGIDSFDAYLERLEGPSAAEEICTLIDSISTNVTSFYRDATHFEFLRQRLGELCAAGRTEIRLWSAACATGQEPYTLAFEALEATASSAGPAPQIRILGTDISGRALDAARRARYREDLLRGVPESVKAKHFHHHEETNEYEVGAKARSLVTFARMNLAAPPYPLHGPFDVVFCRNVMIYFDEAVRLRFLREAHRLLAPDGHLIVASSETMVPTIGPFRNVAPSVFQPIPAAS